MKFRIDRSALVFICVVLGLALSRLLPHPPNFSPVIAIALFSGAVLRDWRLGLLLPLLAMLLADLVLGFHGSMVFVYLAMACVVLVGRTLAAERRPLVLSGAGFGGALLFFVISNAGVWWVQDMYSHDLAGLVTCFVAALPFFHNTLLATLLYGSILFCLERYLKKRGDGLALVG